MNDLNPNAIVFMIFGASAGQCFGHWDIGLAIASGILLLSLFRK